MGCYCSFIFAVVSENQQSHWHFDHQCLCKSKRSALEYGENGMI